MSNSVIRVENLSKKYIIGHQKEQGYLTIRDAIAGGTRKLSQRILHPLKSAHGTASNSEEFWALKDISFDVKPGERLGIIGRNGAGKSTLLKVLSRITEPTSGRVTINGRVSSLLEVGTGFHPELTGRENIYLNGAILGMARQEVKRKFDEIVDFSGVEKFLDTPVKRYSSGMYVRLAFAVAAHLEPDILVVDEVLAVGDAEFQKRCLGRMSEVAESGRTVLFVSHNMGAILSLCQRTIVLDQGRVIDDGPSKESIANYFSDDRFQTGIDGEIGDVSRKGSGIVKLKRLQIFSQTGQIANVLVGGGSYNFTFSVESQKPLNWKRVNVAFNISTQQGTLLAYFNDSYTDGCEDEEKTNEKTYICEMKRFPLVAGKYIIGIFILYNNEVVDHISQASMLHVDKGDFYKSGKQAMRAPVMLDYQWHYK